MAAREAATQGNGVSVLLFPQSDAGKLVLILVLFLCVCFLCVFFLCVCMLLLLLLLLLMMVVVVVSKDYIHTYKTGKASLHMIN